MTVQDIIDDVKPQLYPYVGRYKLTNGILLSHISAVDREVMGEINQIAPSLLAEVGTALTVITDATTANNEHYYTLAGITDPWDIGTFIYKQGDNGKSYKVTIRPQSDLNMPSSDGPEAWLRQDNETWYLHPIDPWGDNWDTSSGAISERNWWDSSDDTVYFYGYSEDSLTSLTSVLNSPQMCKPYIEAAVVVRCLLGDNGVPDHVLQRAVNTMQQTQQTMMLNLHEAGNIESTFGSRKTRQGDSYGSFHARLF